MNQVVLAYNQECEQELLKMGFRKQEVYVKSIAGMTNEETKKRGEGELFRMKTKPFLFCVTSFWGACLD